MLRRFGLRPIFSLGLTWRDSKAVMPRPAKPFRPVRLWFAPPIPFKYSMFFSASFAPILFRCSGSRMDIGSQGIVLFSGALCALLTIS
jgi:hypothetical protein